ncbi:hypothetical protein E2C01_052851 [Portunus trituberculatus]|uniref:Uncharacterized protein n=1 Tax=Portunus trituberculatus TaxID=210409 RepID=A0A5B7GIS8_PORTR|nr:hypothetical protein [Portunus trituberculatus]
MAHAVKSPKISPQSTNTACVPHPTPGTSASTSRLLANLPPRCHNPEDQLKGHPTPCPSLRPTLSHLPSFHASFTASSNSYHGSRPHRPHTSLLSATILLHSVSPYSVFSPYLPSSLSPPVLYFPSPAP